MDGLQFTVGSDAELKVLAEKVTDIVIFLEDEVQRAEERDIRDEYYWQKDAARWLEYSKKEFEKKSRHETKEIPEFFQVKLILPDRLEYHTISCSTHTTVNTFREIALALPPVKKFRKTHGNPAESTFKLRAYSMDQEWLDQKDLLLAESVIIKQWLQQERIPVLLLASDPETRMRHRVNLDHYLNLNNRLKELLDGGYWHTGSEESLYFQRHTAALAASRATHKAIKAFPASDQDMQDHAHMPHSPSSPLSGSSRFLSRDSSLEDVTIAAAARNSSPPIEAQRRGITDRARLRVQLDLSDVSSRMNYIELLLNESDKMAHVVARSLERFHEKGLDATDVVLRLKSCDVDLYEEAPLSDLRSHFAEVAQGGMESSVELQMLRRMPLDPDVLLEASLFAMAVQSAECMVGVQSQLRLPPCTIPNWNCGFCYRFRLIQAYRLIPNKFCPPQWIEKGKPPVGSVVFVEASIVHCGVWLCPPTLSKEVLWSTDPNWACQMEFPISLADLPATARVVVGVYVRGPGERTPAILLGSINWLPVDHKRMLRSGVRRLHLWTEREVDVLDVAFGSPNPSAPEVVIEVERHAAPIVFPMGPGPSHEEDDHDDDLNDDAAYRLQQLYATLDSEERSVDAIPEEELDDRLARSVKKSRLVEFLINNEYEALAVDTEKGRSFRALRQIMSRRFKGENGLVLEIWRQQMKLDAWAKHEEAKAARELLRPAQKRGLLKLNMMSVNCEKWKVCGEPWQPPEAEGRFQALLEKNSMVLLSEDDANFVWSMRVQAFERYHSHPSIVALLSRSVPWGQDRAEADLRELVRRISMVASPLSAPNALVLLGELQGDDVVRSYAVEQLWQCSADVVHLYLLQMIQCLRFEPYHDSPLARFLISKALKDRTVGHALYWGLKSSMEACPELQERYGLILEGYLQQAGASVAILSDSNTVVTELVKIGASVKAAEDNKKATQQLRKQLNAFSEREDCPKSFCLPLSQERFTGFDIQKCKVMTSNARPLWLNLKKEPVKRGSGGKGNGGNYLTMFKMGDDLRQDELTMQILGVMNSLWKDDRVDGKLTLFKVVPTGADIGFVEIVHDSVTCAEITGQTRKLLAGGSLHEWLKEHSADAEALKTMQNNFAVSCAAYCVGSYVLGIADRHNDNIMVRKDGRFFHIDFGHFLGHFTTFAGYNRESAPFIFTPDFESAMGGPNTDCYRLFEERCVRSFNVLRKNSVILLNLLSMMMHSGLEHVQQQQDVDYLLNMLRVDLTDEQAEKHFKDLIQQSLSSWGTLLNFAAHMWVAKFK